jgi:hypothetical protein
VRLASTTRAVLAVLLPCLLSFSSLPPSLALAADEALAAGVRQVEEGDFEGAIVTLGPVVERLAPAGGRDAAQACLYLGIAHLALDQVEPARARFREALGHDPSLRLGLDRFSPKVVGAFEEARREREAAERAAAAAAPGQSPAPKKGGSGRTWLLAGAGVAAGVGAAVALTGSSSTSSGEVRFSGARFAAPAVECPDGSIDRPLAVGIDMDATNDTGGPVPVTSVTSFLTIEISPGYPGEVGFRSAQATTVAPTTVPAGMTTLHVLTTLTCNNGERDAPRYNEWSGGVTIATAKGVVTLTTVDRLRVNIP